MRDEPRSVAIPSVGSCATLERVVYGPVPSRRFGLSLGVDVVPRKVCCYDCTYCQVGPTTQLLVERGRFVDPDEVARQVEAALRRRPEIEQVTLSGSGEPTLLANLVELTTALRQVTAVPLALLTNGGLLWQDDVRAAALQFDVVAPSLDAADPDTFVALNRPHPEVSFDRMVTGLRQFCCSFAGTCRLEVMLVRGVNDSPASLDRLAALAASLGPSAVDLNTVVRPPAFTAHPLEPSALSAALKRFSACRASIIAPYRGSEESRPLPPAALHDRILELVARRPCTLDDLCSGLTAERATLLAACDEALAAGDLTLEETEGGSYYVVAQR